MRIAIFIDKRQENEMTFGHAFAAGLKAHGENPQIIYGTYPTECDLAVFTGWHENKNAIMERQMADGNDFISMDLGILGDHSKWRSIGYNGHKRHADFCIDEMPPTRANRYKWKFKPWKPGNEYILLIGQFPGATTSTGLDIQKRIDETIANIGMITNTPIKVRPHPDPQSSHKEQKQSMAADLAGATCVVAYDSNAAVDAILAGVPCIVLDEGGMAWPMAGHYVEDVLDPPMPDDETRQQWLNNLAHCQWTKKEIESGATWEHLKIGPADPDDATAMDCMLASEETLAKDWND